MSSRGSPDYSTNDSTPKSSSAHDDPDPKRSRDSPESTQDSGKVLTPADSSSGGSRPGSNSKRDGTGKVRNSISGGSEAVGGRGASVSSQSPASPVAVKSVSGGRPNSPRSLTPDPAKSPPASASTDEPAPKHRRRNSFDSSQDSPGMVTSPEAPGSGTWSDGRVGSPDKLRKKGASPGRGKASSEGRRGKKGNRLGSKSSRKLGRTDQAQVSPQAAGSPARERRSRSRGDVEGSVSPSRTSPVKNKRSPRPGFGDQDEISRTWKRSKKLGDDGRSSSPRGDRQSSAQSRSETKRGRGDTMGNGELKSRGDKSEERRRRRERSATRGDTSSDSSDAEPASRSTGRENERTEKRHRESNAAPVGSSGSAEAGRKVTSSTGPTSPARDSNEASSPPDPEPLRGNVDRNSSQDRAGHGAKVKSLAKSSPEPGLDKHREEAAAEGGKASVRSDNGLGDDKDDLPPIKTKVKKKKKKRVMNEVEEQDGESGGVEDGSGSKAARARDESVPRPRASEGADSGDPTQQSRPRVKKYKKVRPVADSEGRERSTSPDTLRRKRKDRSLHEGVANNSEKDIGNARAGDDGDGGDDKGVRRKGEGDSVDKDNAKPQGETHKGGAPRDEPRTQPPDKQDEDVLAPTKKKRKKKRVFDTDETFPRVSAALPTSFGDASASSLKSDPLNGPKGISPTMSARTGTAAGSSRENLASGVEDRADQRSSSKDKGAITSAKMGSAASGAASKQAAPSEEDEKLMRGLRKYLKDAHVK